MRKPFVIFFILLFSFCSKKEQTYPRVILPKQKNAIQVNTNTMLHISLDNAGSFFVGNFDSDTIVDLRNINRDEDFKKFKWDTVFPKYDFKIMIDTSYTYPAKGFEYNNIEFEKKGVPDFHKVFSLWDDYVVCYPLLIYNNGNKPAYSGEYIRLIQEAKDKEGKWKPIEFFAGTPSCIPLPYFREYLPKKYSGLSIIKYNGDFKTKIRVKAKIGKYIYYSNEINGRINLGQFDQRMAREMMKYLCQFCDGKTPVSEERLSYVFLNEKQN